MCGRYPHRENQGQLAEFLRGIISTLKPNYNVVPNQMVPAVRDHAEGGREFVILKWGLVPSWTKAPSIGYKMIKARGETVAEKLAFRKAPRRRRCLKGCIFQVV